MTFSFTAVCIELLELPTAFPDPFSRTCQVTFHYLWFIKSCQDVCDKLMVCTSKCKEVTFCFPLTFLMILIIRLLQFDYDIFNVVFYSLHSEFSGFLSFIYLFLYITNLRTK